MNIPSQEEGHRELWFSDLHPEFGMLLGTILLLTWQVYVGGKRVDARSTRGLGNAWVLASRWPPGSFSSWMDNIN